MSHLAIYTHTRACVLGVIYLSSTIFLRAAKPRPQPTGPGSRTVSLGVKREQYSLKFSITAKYHRRGKSFTACDVAAPVAMEGTNATLLAACGALAGRVAKLEEVRLRSERPACVYLLYVCVVGRRLGPSPSSVGWAAASRPQ